MKTEKEKKELMPPDATEGETAPKIEACEGKKRGDRCMFETSNGTMSEGKCIPRHYGSGLYCSDLNLKKDESSADTEIK